MTSSILRRLGALTLTIALGSAAVAAAPSASAAPRPTPPAAGADWLVTQLTGGVIHDDQYDFDDYGLTADTGFALAAIEGQSPALRKLRAALGKHVASCLARLTPPNDLRSEPVVCANTSALAVDPA